MKHLLLGLALACACGGKAQPAAGSGSAAPKASGSACPAGERWHHCASSSCETCDDCIGGCIPASP